VPESSVIATPIAGGASVALARLRKPT
jgi:hypothetical protein